MFKESGVFNIEENKKKSKDPVDNEGTIKQELQVTMNF